MEYSTERLAAETAAILRATRDTPPIDLRTQIGYALADLFANSDPLFDRQRFINNALRP